MNGLYDEIRVMAHQIWKRRWLALAVAWAVCVLGWLFVSMIPNRYESEARVYVQMQSLLPDKIGVTPAERQRDVERVRRTLTSKINLEKVVRGTDLAQRATTNRDITDMAAGLQKKIKVLEEQENLFKITAESSMGGMSDGQNAKLSRAIVQKLIDIFVDENLSGDRMETSQTLRFLDQQIAQREVLMRESEGKRVAFEQKHMGLIPGIGSMDQRMAAARAEINQIESSLVAAQSSLAAINAQMGSTPPSIASPSYGGFGGGPAASRAAQIEGQIAEGRSRGWTESHPDMAALRAQLGSARSAANAEARQGGGGPGMMANPAYGQLRAIQAEKQATVSALSSRKAQLQSEIGQWTAKQIAEPGLAAEYQRLTQDFEVVKAQYDKLLADREDVRLRGQMQTTTDAVKFRVIDPPSLPRSPAAPSRGLLLGVVLLVGTIAGVGAAFVMSQLQTGFSVASKLEAASGLPVIGSITEVLTPAQRETAGRRMRLFFGGTGALLAVFALLVVIETVQLGSVA